MEKLYQITAPHFCAGVLSRNGIIVDAAPSLGGWIGRHETALVIYARRKKWGVEIVSGTPLPR